MAERDDGAVQGVVIVLDRLVFGVRWNRRSSSKCVLGRKSAPCDSRSMSGRGDGWRDGRRAGRTREPSGNARPSGGGSIPDMAVGSGDDTPRRGHARLRAEEQAVAGARIGSGDPAHMVAAADDRTACRPRRRTGSARYRVDSGDREKVSTPGGPRPPPSGSRLRSAWRRETGTWTSSYPIPWGGRTIYSEYLEQRPAGGIHRIGGYFAADR